MNNKYQPRKTQPRRLIFTVSMAVLLLAISAGCAPASTGSPEQPTQSEAEQQAEPTSSSSTATTIELLPAGWVTHTSQRCEYEISYPQEMEVTDNGTYSDTLQFELANPEEGARNFAYVTVIDQDIQSLDVEAAYNYDPEEAETLLNMQVGESVMLHEDLNVERGFTYQRIPDTQISSQAAQTYENLEPWEFPPGTKEMRYYISLDGCTYQIGGYLDTEGSELPGAISEALFDQIVSTIKLNP